MDHSILFEVNREVADSVAVTPVAASEFSAPFEAKDSVVEVEAELRVYGEVEIEVEERGEVELHRGNTEFDYQSEVVKVDTRGEIVKIPMDRICFSGRHYEV